MTMKRKAVTAKDIAGLLIPFAAYLIAGAAVLAIAGSLLGEAYVREHRAVIMIFEKTLQLAALLLVCDRQALYLHLKRKIHMKQLAVALPAAVILSLGVQMILQATPLPEMFRQYETVTGAIYEEAVILQLLLSVVLAPIVEELLLRGMLMNRLMEICPGDFAEWKRMLVTIGIPAVIFAFLHGNLIQGIYAFVLGIAFGFMRVKTHSIVPPILAHALVNLVSIIMQAAGV